MRFVFVLALAASYLFLSNAQEPNPKVGEVGEKRALPEIMSLRVKLAWAEWQGASAELEAAQSRVQAASASFNAKQGALMTICEAQLKQGGLTYGVWDCLPDGTAVRKKIDPPPPTPAESKKDSKEEKKAEAAPPKTKEPSTAKKK